MIGGSGTRALSTFLRSGRAGGLGRADVLRRHAVLGVLAVALGFGPPPLLADADPARGDASPVVATELSWSAATGVTERTAFPERAQSASPVTFAASPGRSADGGGLQALGLGAGPSEARDDPEGIPPVSEAFRPSARMLDDGTFAVTVDIGRCCYLYRDRLTVRGLDGAALGEPAFPPGERYEDAFYGETVVYRNALEFRVPVLGPDGVGEAPRALELDYQGCADAGVCYPPETRRLTIEPVDPGADAVPSGGMLASSSATPSPPAPAATYRSEQDRLGATLERRGLLALPLFFGLGLLLAFTPCVLPMVPILSGIIGAGGASGTGRAFALSSVYVVAMATTYAAFGLLAAASGANVQAAFQHPAIIGASAALFVALALAMFGLYELQLPRTWQERLVALSGRQRGGRFAGVGLMGAFSALIVGPCVAAPLIGVLGYIAATGDLALGGLTLFVLGLGMGAPLLVVGTSAGRLIPRAGAWTRVIKAGFGVGLLAVAIWLLERIAPATLTLALWASLAIALSIVLLFGLGRALVSPPVQRFGQGLGLTLGVYGVLLLVGAGSGAETPLRPLEGFSVTSASDGTRAGDSTAPRFERVTTSAALDAALASAETRARPLLLDFYADWCVTCKEMERDTFTDPAVAAAMSRFDLIKADVTANDGGNRELLERFSILGPPATVFFDPSGREQRAFRTAGFLDAERFLVVLEAALADASLADARTDEPGAAAAEARLLDTNERAPYPGPSASPRPNG